MQGLQSQAGPSGSQGERRGHKAFVGPAFQELFRSGVCIHLLIRSTLTPCWLGARHCEVH